MAMMLLLVAGLAASALLPGDGPVFAALAVIIVLGVPHGALDGEIARPWLRPAFGRGWFLVFAAPYLCLAASVLVAWRSGPVATLMTFLLASVWHFGTEDAGPDRPLEALARGGLPIAVPVLLHPDATAHVFGVVTGVMMPEVPAWLMDAAMLWVLAATVGAAAMWRQSRSGALAEMAGLLVVFAALPPLTAFAAYFVGFHAPRHMGMLASHPVRAPRASTMRAAALLSVPVTVLTLLIGIALWPTYDGMAANRLLALTLQGLAALTLPHLVLEHLAEACEGRRARVGELAVPGKA